MPAPESLLQRLHHNGVEFVIIGGYAAAAHGATLLTQDLDICCRFTPKNLLRIQKALADLTPVHRMTPARLPLRLTQSSCRGLKNLYLDTNMGQLDCLGHVMGIGGYPVAKKRSVAIRIGGSQFRILDMDALIEAKKAMGRPRDLQAVIELEAIRKHTGAGVPSPR